MIKSNSKKTTIENIRIINLIKQDLKTLDKSKIIKTSTFKIKIIDIIIISNSINKAQINLNDIN